MIWGYPYFTKPPYRYIYEYVYVYVFAYIYEYISIDTYIIIHDKVASPHQEQH